MVLPQDKPLAKLGAGSASRSETFNIFIEEIEIMYSRVRLRKVGLDIPRGRHPGNFLPA